MCMYWIHCSIFIYLWVFSKGWQSLLEYQNNIGGKGSIDIISSKTLSRGDKLNQSTRVVMEQWSIVGHWNNSNSPVQVQGDLGKYQQGESCGLCECCALMTSCSCSATSCCLKSSMNIHQSSTTISWLSCS